MLTSDQLQQYEEDGYIALPGFLREDQVQEIQSRVKRFIAERISQLPREHIFCDVVGEMDTLKQIQHMHNHDAWFGELIGGGAIRSVAEQILGSEVVPKNLQYFNKPPGVSLPTPPHQDGYYFMLDPCKAVTLWLALDTVDEGNGCVRYVPGSHRRGVRSHGRTGTLGFSQGITDYPQQADREVPVTSAPGDLLAHDAMTIHRADANESPHRHRRALGFIYYSVHAQEDAVAHAAYQARLAEELKNQGKI